MLELNAQHPRIRSRRTNRPRWPCSARCWSPTGWWRPATWTACAREAQGSTFLGQGIAIPMAPRKPAIRCSPRACGCCIFVDWGNGQQVHLAIGIAARSDEHLRLLQLLTRALGEGDLSEALQNAESPRRSSRCCRARRRNWRSMASWWGWASPPRTSMSWPGRASSCSSAPNAWSPASMPGSRSTRLAAG